MGTSVDVDIVQFSGSFLPKLSVVGSPHHQQEEGSSLLLRHALEELDQLSDRKNERHLGAYILPTFSHNNKLFSGIADIRIELCSGSSKRSAPGSRVLLALHSLVATQKTAGASALRALHPHLRAHCHQVSPGRCGDSLAQAVFQYRKQFDCMQTS